MTNIAKYLPFRTSEKYLVHHLTHFAKCVDNGLYSSAYYHLHILYMCFIYFQLFRIEKEKTRDFKIGWIGFPREEIDFYKSKSPFGFANVREKSVFRFFRLLDSDIAFIRPMAKLVDRRNDRMHANGKIDFIGEEDFTKEVRLYVTQMENIVKKQEVILSEIYEKIIESFDDAYIIGSDELESSFSQPYYFSIYELSLLSKNDIATDCIAQEMENFE